VLAH
jgi:uncharacterized Zn ribbon protein